MFKMYQGQIMAQGTYDHLVSNGIDFVSLMTSEASADEAIRKLSVVHQDEVKYINRMNEIVS
jgi:hypothetical protein